MDFLNAVNHTLGNIEKAQIRISTYNMPEEKQLEIKEIVPAKRGRKKKTAAETSKTTAKSKTTKAKSADEKAAGKKTTAKKSVAKKTAVKKAAPKKVAPKKPTADNAETEKTTVKTSDEKSE